MVGFFAFGAGATFALKTLIAFLKRRRGRWPHQSPQTRANRRHHQQQQQRQHLRWEIEALTISRYVYKCMTCRADNFAVCLYVHGAQGTLGLAADGLLFSLEACDGAAKLMTIWFVSTNDRCTSPVTLYCLRP